MSDEGGIQRRDRTLRRLLRDHPLSILALGIICLLFGIAYQKFDALETFSDWHAYAGIFIKELGFALIIAYFLTIGIEALQRDSHNKHVSGQIDRIKRDVFEAVYSTRQDRNLVALLESEIFNQPFFRQAYSVNVTMTLLDRDIECNSESKVQLDIQCEFYAANRTNVTRDFHFRAFVERPFEEDDDVARLTFLKLGEQYFDSERELSEVDQRKPDTPDFRHYEWSATVARGESIHVVSKYRLVKRARDYLVWQVLDAADGLRIDVTLPEPGLLRIFGDAIHPCQDRLQKIGGHEEDHTFSLRVDQPLLPHNGVQIWWGPAPKLATARAEEVTRV